MEMGSEIGATNDEDDGEEEVLAEDDCDNVEDEPSVNINNDFFPSSDPAFKGNNSLFFPNFFLINFFLKSLS